MTETVYLTPKRGLTVRDPEDFSPLPDEGRAVALTGYWQRRIDDGDVRVGTPETTTPKAAKAAAKE